MPNSQSDNIYDILLSLILSDKLEIGDKLPTEMELCNKYSIARSTVREAVSKLQAKGYVEVKRGSGTYIISKEVNTNSNALIIDKITNLDDFMEIRLTIETLAVRLFIKNYSDDKLDRLSKVEKQFEKAIKEKNVKKMAMLDEAFHKTIFECTENELLMSIGEVLSISFRHYRTKTFENESHRNDAVFAHNKIVDSLKRKDTNDAILNMHQHLNTSLINATKKS